jgi:hypothetical protein
MKTIAMTSETTPLLHGNETNASVYIRPTIETQSSALRGITFANQLLLHWQRWKTFYLGVLLLVSFDFSGSLMIAPAMRLLEDLVCREHHGQQRSRKSEFEIRIPDELCGLPDVQEHLARVRGTLNILESLPGE